MQALLLLFLSFTAVSLPLKGVGAPTVLYQNQSRYHFIRVIESGNVRTLTFRRKGYDRNQSQVDISDPLRPCLPYYRLMFAGYLFVPEPQRVLVVGLGGGVVSRLSAHYFPEAHVDTVELDPAVLDVAKRFFGFQEGNRLRVFVRDGRVQIKAFRAQHATYDVVMLDAFRGGFVPYHLMTTEFFQECRDILSPRGALVVNLKPGWVIYQYQRRTLASVFPEQYPFGGASGSEIVVAIPSERKITKDWLLAAATTLQQRRKFSFRLPDVAAQFDIGPGFSPNGPIFTDGYVPANILKRQLENPGPEYNLPVTAFDRLAAWLRNYRLSIISFALVLIVVGGLLQKRLRARALERPPPHKPQTKPG